VAGKTGQCCICGVEGELSFEHVPPRAAYNDQRIFEANIQAMMKEDEAGRKARGKWVQGGAAAIRSAGSATT
jgi:hypothetical protein